MYTTLCSAQSKINNGSYLANLVQSASFSASELLGKFFIMDSKKEQMVTIHKMCCNEINLLKTNLDKRILDSTRCQNVLGELIKSLGVSNTFVFDLFDQYMTQMLAVLNMARKYNLYLDVHNLDQTVNLASNYIDDANFSRNIWKNVIELKKCQLDNCATRKILPECQEEILEPLKEKIDYVDFKCLTDETSEMLKKIDNLLNFLFPEKNFTNFKAGFEFHALVVHVPHYKELEFFICLNDDFKTLNDITGSISLKPLSIDLLPQDDLFCIQEKRDTFAKGLLLRAVIVPELNKKLQKFLYLMDFGEIVQLTKNVEAFEAPLQYRQIPPLAIKSILKGVESSSLNSIVNDQNKSKRALQKNLGKKAFFRIEHEENGIFNVIMLKKPAEVQSSSPINIKDKTKNLLNSKDVGSIKRSSTLQFTNSVLDGNNFANDDLSVSYEVGNTIQVVVTHIVSPISFYGIIHTDCSADNTVLSWNNDQIFTQQKQMSPAPKLNEIVLAQYLIDGYWYRAKITNIDSQKNLYKVFFVDFGNTEVVSVACLAKCTEEQLKYPLRAVFFQMCNLKIIAHKEISFPSENSEQKKAIEKIVVMILEQTVNLEVIRRLKDGLVVRLIDTQYADIPKMLIDMGVVEEILT